jgi:hypothetical protein
MADSQSARDLRLLVPPLHDPLGPLGTRGGQKVRVPRIYRVHRSQGGGGVVCQASTARVHEMSPAGGVAGGSFCLLGFPAVAPVA